MHLHFSTQKDFFRIAYSLPKGETIDCGKKLAKQIYLDSDSKIKPKIKLGY